MPRYGSDLIVDLLNKYEIPYAAFNPGATFRGIHDSIVNYAENHPQIIECPHEEIAVGMAHGYAKATGRPMAVILHDLVGLLHATMSIYYAYIDRVPMMILGAAGPMAVGRRRPTIDWDHTATLQGSVVREFVKWEDQPFDVHGIAHSFARGYRVARTEPAGPVYIAYDVAFQEDELTTDIGLPDPSRGGLSSRLAIESSALNAVVSLLLQAQRPVILTDLVGRHAESVQTLVELAEFLASPVIDLGERFNFPNTHPLFALDRKALKDADLVLALDVRDLHGSLAKVDDDKRPLDTQVIPGDCRIISIGVADLETSGWSQNNQRFQPVDLSVLADTYTALPEILGGCRSRAAEATPESSVKNREARLNRWQENQLEQRAAWRQAAKANWDAVPMTPARMVLEVGQALQGKDWVLTANTVKDWARKLWDFDKPYQHPGESLGTSTQIAISLGVALAYQGTGKLVVDLQPDGDLMYDAGALWVAAHHHLPMLVVMYNNRAYYNSWDHQSRMSGWRGRSRKNVHLGVEIDNPPPDFAGLARSLGWYAEGPITKGDDLPAALARAIHVIETTGQPALVDAVTGHGR